METESEMRDCVCGHRLCTPGVPLAEVCVTASSLRTHCTCSDEAAAGVLFPPFALNR